MGYPLRMRDGSIVVLELKSGVELPTEEEKEALRDYVEFLLDHKRTEKRQTGSAPTAMGKPQGQRRLRRVTKAKS